MVTKSALPGRVRFQINDLCGKAGLCQGLETALAQREGVLQVQASHRTGALFVRFDTDRINRESLVDGINWIIRELKSLPEEQLSTQAQPKPVFPDSRFKQLARDFALMGIKNALPKPLGMLLPVAMDFIRR